MGNAAPVGVSNKNKLIRFGIPLAILIVVVIVLLLVYSKAGKLPTTSIFQKKADVKLKTEYKNPFDKNTQYVNPFETYKNPFVVSK